LSTRPVVFYTATATENNVLSDGILTKTIIVGILAGVRPCGVIVLLAELFRAESTSQVYATLHEFLRNHEHVFEKLGKQTFQSLCSNVNCACIACSQEFICYDDGCHLRKFTQHSTRKNVTATAQKLSETEIVIDKLHMAGHTDKWCKENCDPHHFQALDKVCVYA
jgi:hypothetical protein